MCIGASAKSYPAPLPPPPAPAPPPVEPQATLPMATGQFMSPTARGLEAATSRITRDEGGETKRVKRKRLGKAQAKRQNLMINPGYAGQPISGPINVT